MLKWIISGSYGVQVEAETSKDAIEQAKKLPLGVCAYEYKTEKYEPSGLRRI